MNFEKKFSKIHGVGIFAKRKILKSACFYKVPLNNVCKKPKAKCARISDDKYVFDGEVLNWVNHSCEPNSRLDVSGKNPLLIAIRGILPGEEIVVDYNKTEKNNTKVKCDCKAENCQGYFFIS